MSFASRGRRPEKPWNFLLLVACMFMALKNIFPSSGEPLNTGNCVVVCIGNAGKQLHSACSLLMVHFTHGLLLRFVWLSDTLGAASRAAGSPSELCKLPCC